MNLPLRHVPSRESFRLGSSAVCFVTGAVGALAVTFATFLVFGPFSDLSARQLAAGPQAAQSGAAGLALVTARTGRSWGSTELQRLAEAPSTRVAQALPASGGR